MGHVYLTGDIHGNADRIEDFCTRMHTSKNDIMIILGDVGCNYYGNHRDKQLKRFMELLPITFVLLRGNHEARPKEICGDSGTYHLAYRSTENIKGLFLYEYEFPSLNFMIEDNYDITTYDGKKINAFAIGGAYSVDKYYRLANNWPWFEDEQLSQAEMEQVDGLIRLVHFDENPIDLILSHTCPYSYRPVDMFIPNLDQSTVDNSMELWMDDINKLLNHPKWYCGHWHTDRSVENVRFIYKDIIEL